MLTIDWTEVGAIATAVAVLVGVAGVVALALLVRAARGAVVSVDRLAEAGRQVAQSGQALTGRGDELVELASRRAELGELATGTAQDHLRALRQQVGIGELILAGTHAPLLVPSRLSSTSRDEGPLHVVLPDGVYYAPTEQSVGAWTIEPGERKLVVSCAFRNVGVGPAILHPYHRIDVVRRSTLQPLVSFGGFANGVVGVGDAALVGFPLSSAEPSFAATLALLDRPDDEMQLMVTLYYRSASSNRPLWARVRYQRHLRTSPAGLLSEVSLELSEPESQPDPEFQPQSQPEPQAESQPDPAAHEPAVT